MRKDIIKNYFYSLGLNFFKLAAPVLVIPIVYREIRPYEMGLVNLTISIMTYFYIVGDLGTYIYGFREVSLFKKNKLYISTIFTEIFLLRAIVNTTIIISYIFYIYYLSEPVISKYYYYIAGIQLLSTYFNVEWMYEANEKFKFISLKTVVIRSAYIIVTIIFVKGPYAATFYLISLSTFLLVNNLVSFCLLMKDFKWCFKKIKPFRHLKKMFIIFVMINWSMLYFQLDKLVLGKQDKIVEVGYYTLAERVITLGGSALFSLIMVVTPRLGSFINLDLSHYKLLLNKVFNIILAVLIPFTVFIFSLSPEIVLLMGGRNYYAAIEIMQVFVWYIAIYVILEMLKTNVLLLFQKENIFFYAVIAGGLINIILKFSFFPMTDIEIVATTIFVSLLIIIFLFLYVKNYLEVTLLESKHIKIFIASVPLLFLYYIQVQNIYYALFLKSVIFILYFISFILIFDKSLLKLILRKQVK
mgnify:CR=1 FL=1